MQLIDTHCHLDFPDFDADRDLVIKRAKEAGIEFIINVGSSLAASRKALVLSKQYNNVFATVGIHPHEADKVKEEDFFEIEQLARQDKVKAIGEVGLDYFRNLSTKSNQIKVFKRFIQLSKIINLPLIIHCRQSQDDLLSILSEEKLETKVLMHCFSGDAFLLKRCLDLGFFISFTCNVTYKKAFDLKDVVKLTPLDRLMLETDAPFLAPEGFRGKRNEPMHLKLLALEVARIKGVDLEEIARMTTNNAKDFFPNPIANFLVAGGFVEYTTYMNSKVAILKCNSYDSPLVLDAVRRAVGLLGGISAFVKPGSKVLVKPNLLMSKEPECGITTHPEVVRSVIRLLKEVNCKIFVGDSPSVWADYIENVDTVYERTGITKLCSQENVELVKFDKRRWRKNFPLTTWLDTCDYLVNVPKFKTHELTILTGAIKNLFGLVCGTYKLELHKNHFNPDEFSKILVDIYEETRPALTVIDAIVAMQGDGPATSGKLVNTGLILAGSDALALDSILARIMNLFPLDILTNKEAASRNLGQAEINSIEILGESLELVINKPFELPASSKKSRLPRPVIALAKRLIKYYPCVEANNCIRCSICIKTCPEKVITMTKKGIKFDYPGCIACFCCQEACPAAAIKVKKSLLAKIIGL